MPISTRDISNSKPAVMVSGLPKQARKLFKTRVILMLLILLISLGIIFSVASSYHNKLMAKKVINQAKVSALIKSNNCSNTAQQSVSAEQPDPSKVQASITLLSYRASCLIETGKYKEANQILEQLKVYYDKENNITAIASLNQQISANSYAAAHPVKHIVKIPADISPQYDRKINTFFGNSQ
jgi:hypothetical protein